MQFCAVVWVVREPHIGGAFLDPTAAEFFAPLLHSRCFSIQSIRLVIHLIVFLQISHRGRGAIAAHDLVAIMGRRGRR